MSIVLLSCNSSKTKSMAKKDNKNDLCDIEAGICSPDNSLYQNKAIKSKSDSLGKIKLTYYYDALCGWCYGFSPVMSKLQDEFGHKLNIEVISGGLFLGNRAGLVNEVAPHIKAGAYKSVEDKTGVKFGESFLIDVFGEGKMILSSLPPSIALCIVREKYPEKQLEFAEMLLRAVYFDGINPTIIDDYKNYVTKIGFDLEEFNTKMKDDKYKKMAEEEFSVFRSSQFSGMPALVLEKENQQILLTKGYTNFDELRIIIEQFLE